MGFARMVENAHRPCFELFEQSQSQTNVSFIPRHLEYPDMMTGKNFTGRLPSADTD